MSTTRSSRRLVILATIMAALCAAPGVTGATQPSDLCTGNPCVVTGAITVDAGSVLDFGSAVALQIQGQATLTVGPGPAAREITLRAGEIVLEPGARILGGSDTAEVTLEAATGDVKVQRSGASSALIDLSAPEGGTANLEAAGKVAVHGVIDVQGKGRNAQGGSIVLDAGDEINVSGSLLVAATSAGSAGGEISLHAGTAISATGTMSTAGGDFGAGDIDLVADAGDVTLGGTIEASGGAPEGYGGAIDVLAAGSVALGATLNARGASGAGEACGDGGALSVDADANVVFSAPIDLTGGRHCLGGSVLVMAGADVTQLASGSIAAPAAGAFGGGGDIDLSASGNISLRRIDVTSPGSAGLVTLDADSHIAIEDHVDASGTGANAFAGAIDATACEIDVTATGRLSVLGLGDASAGVNVLRAGGAMTIAGTLEAATANELRHRTVAPTVTGSVTPAATIVADPSVRSCPIVPVCGNHVVEGDETCDDGNTSSCDGCRGDCRRADAVCGDGIPECGEACDDGNQIDGDGCETTCELSPLSGIRRPGAPSATAGCLAEWALGPAAVIDAATGFASVRQVCTDGDPACDRDGAADGVCTYELRACLRAPDPGLPACTPASIDSVKLRTPRSSGGDPVDAANAAALRAALAALGVTVREGAQLVSPGAPVATADACTAPIALRVPTADGAPATRKLSIGSRDTAGLAMTTNPLRLRCKPRPERCGDGILQEGEECDLGDQNGELGGRCDAACRLAPPALRIPGGSGSRRHDCPFEWAVDLGPDGVRSDRRGIPTYVQTCRDGDPTCDLDPTPGNCRLRLWACVGGSDARLSCGATAVRSVDIVGPRADASHPFESQAHDALASALGALGFPAGPGEACTRHFEVDVPTGPSRLTLRVATGFGNRSQVDSDALVLRCRR